MSTQFKHMAMWTWPGAVRDEDPKRMIRRLKEAHVDIIMPYTCPQRGNASPPKPYFERLHGIIEEAHRRGLKVHACFDEVNAYKDMPVYDLKQVRKDGSKGGILCHANPKVVGYVLEKLRWTLTEFEYDGIDLEDSYIFNRNTIYDPAHMTGEKYQVIPVCYCDYCRKNAPLEKPEWDQWKRDQLSALIGKEAELIRKTKPGMSFSVAARMPYNLTFYAPHQKDIPYFDGWKCCQSRDALLADWVEWLRRGHIDFACPMSYYHSNRIVELQTLECQRLIPEARRKVWMGLGLNEVTAEYRQGKTDEPGVKDVKDPSLKNGAAAIETLLRDQVRMGQENVLFFCYEGLLDEHLPVMAQFRTT
ncbi:MAG: family 10 glycosylhydrolase [Verrucomicrobia bacterium]|nr:family 10 glycosylhydrolase [Verrucomicrobiota bacterium]